MANIKTKIRIEAGTQTHCLFTKTSESVANEISVPKLGVSFGKPKPKKVYVVSIPILPAKFIVKLVIINELKLGMISLNIILKSFVPNVFEAET